MSKNIQLQQMKQEVCDANLALVKHDLVQFTWGNVSAIDREHKLVVIKPSGVSYDTMSPDDMVVVDLDGNIIDGKLKPSVDLQTHLELYRSWENIGAVVHTHSTHATSWAQAGRDIPCFGTTHADYFFGNIPCTRPLKKKELEEDYERNTGRIIVKHVGNKNPLDIPAILVANHGPFAWGKDAISAVHNAAVLEQVAKMAMNTVAINYSAEPVGTALLKTHYMRKHGANAYYGQRK